MGWNWVEKTDLSLVKEGVPLGGRRHNHKYSQTHGSNLLWRSCPYWLKKLADLKWELASRFGQYLDRFFVWPDSLSPRQKTKYSSQDHGSMSKGCFLFWVSLHFFGNIPCLPPFSEFVSGPKSFEKPRHRAGIEGGTATGDNLWRSDVVGWVDCKWKFLGTEAKPVYYELFNYYDIYIHIYICSLVYYVYILYIYT